MTHCQNHRNCRAFFVVRSGSLARSCFFEGAMDEDRDGLSRSCGISKRPAASNLAVAATPLPSAGVPGRPCLSPPQTAWISWLKGTRRRDIAGRLPLILSAQAVGPDAGGRAVERISGPCSDQPGIWPQADRWVRRRRGPGSDPRPVSRSRRRPTTFRPSKGRFRFE